VNGPDQKVDESLIAELHAPPANGDLPTPITDCWNTIGVTGNASCRELDRYIHCRNCPVYSAAALKLLDRPLSIEYRKLWTEHYAAKKKYAARVKSSVIIFRIGPEWLALPTAAFQEVAERRSIHSLPHRRRRVVLGLVNVRGELLICVSLSRLLVLEQAKTTSKSRTVFDRFLVACWDGGRFVFPVDEVHGIHRLNQEQLREPPSTIAHSAMTHTSSIFSWRDRTVGVLNADDLFAALNRNLT
jgi:chemotaxis-related protein WspD